MPPKKKPATKPKTRTGITTSFLLRPHQAAALDQLAAETGLTKNEIIRRVAESMSASEVLSMPASENRT